MCSSLPLLLLALYSINRTESLAFVSQIKSKRQPNVQFFPSFYSSTSITSSSLRDLSTNHLLRLRSGTTSTTSTTTSTTTTSALFFNKGCHNNNDCSNRESTFLDLNSKSSDSDYEGDYSNALVQTGAWIGAAALFAIGLYFVMVSMILQCMYIFTCITSMNYLFYYVFCMIGTISWNRILLWLCFRRVSICRQSFRFSSFIRLFFSESK